MPLLLRPGFLSAEFNIGHRARYMPPFRLYIVISFVLFLVLSLRAGDGIIVNADDHGEATVFAPVIIGDELAGVPGERRERVEETLRRTPELRSTEAQPDPAGADATDEAVAEAGAAAQSAEAVKAGDTLRIDFVDDDMPAWMQHIERRMQDNANRIEDDPGEFVDALFEYLPQTMFLMLPLFALLLKLLYLFSPFHYLQHLVFALHYHSFVYLLYLLGAAVDALQWHGGDFLALALPIYLPLALRTAYGSGWGGAIGKSLLLAVAYALVLVVGFGAVAMVALAFM